ncbi:MAG: hypothetical protein RJA76_963 [Bacteroidota bacterium]|jgi:hypothetical protein
MKKSILTAVYLLIGFFLRAQVYSGNAEMDGLKKDGFYVYLKGSEDAVLSSWKTFVKEFGVIEKSKNSVVSVNKLKIPSIDKKDIFLISKVFSENEKIKLFVSIQNNSAEIIKSGHEDYRAASNWLEEFSNHFSLEENARIEQEKLDELLRNRTKIQRMGERLIREMEANNRQTDLLNKKLEDAKLQKEKIITNQEQNKLDIQKIEIEVIQQRKNVETAKQKIK